MNERAILEFERDLSDARRSIAAMRETVEELITRLSTGKVPSQGRWYALFDELQNVQHELNQLVAVYQFSLKNSMTVIELYYIPDFSNREVGVETL